MTIIPDRQKKRRVAIAPKRVFHSSLLANELFRLGMDVDIISAAPRRFFRTLRPEVRVRPSVLPFAIAERIATVKFGSLTSYVDPLIYDCATSFLLGEYSIFVGWASSCLRSGRKAKLNSAKFVLDRACPHVAFQQNVLLTEACAHNLTFTPQPRWFVDRQVQEYAEADLILCPSLYAARTFPVELQTKVRVAPLFGRVPAGYRQNKSPGGQFTVGVVGGDPVRKGYIHLLQAWRQLRLPDAKLRIRSDEIKKHKPLLQLAKSCENVELVGYVPNINDFYRSCDVFILPSIDDGFGMALFEAMSNEVACIATRNCGASELVRDDRDALVIPAFDADAIAKAIEALYRNAEYRIYIGRNGRALISSFTKYGGSTIYRNALSKVFSTDLG
jgi:glycosyltransferase involved in cell wall biosynthesis